MPQDGVMLAHGPLFVPGALPNGLSTSRTGESLLHYAVGSPAAANDSQPLEWPLPAKAHFRVTTCGGRPSNSYMPYLNLAFPGIQLRNEDSLLWRGVSSLEGDALALLRRRFAEFLVRKHGSFEKARFPGLPQRSADQLGFLARTMHRFNTDMAAYLRKELGCKQLLNANNRAGHRRAAQLPQSLGTQDPLPAEEPGWDCNRDQGNIPLTSSIKTVLDYLAYLVGPVRVVYDDDPAKSTAIDPAKYIDRERKIVRSITGEIETDYGRGIYRVNAPKAQAVAGFPGDTGPQHLADVETTCRSRHATIVVVPLDDQPIRESGKVLIQVGTLARPTGWTVRAARVRHEGEQTDAWYVLSTGKAPWQVEKADATVTVANPRLAKAALLDMNGMPTSTRIDLAANEGRVSVRLPTNTLHLVLTAARWAAPPTQSRQRRRRNK